MARDHGFTTSERLGIRDEVLALDFDRAVSLRLLRFDNERMEQNAKVTAYQVSKIFVSPEDREQMAIAERSDSVLDADILEILKNDRYADEDTVIL